MTKAEQTPKVLETLYNLTFKFTRKWAPRYYKQYRGDVDDLASEFYCQFITPKSRDGQAPESLLDKYDESQCPSNLSKDMFFANLVKICVQRMLIDRSRADQVSIKSLDSSIDEYGDSVYSQIALDEDFTIDNFDPSEVESSIKSRLQKLTKSELAALRSSFTQVRSVITPAFREVFDRCLNPTYKISTTQGYLPLLSLTSQSIVLQAFNTRVVFDRATGLPRKPYPIQVSPEGLHQISLIR